MESGVLATLTADTMPSWKDFVSMIVLFRQLLPREAGFELESPSTLF
jgi:hypothetical protein